MYRSHQSFLGQASSITRTSALGTAVLQGQTNKQLGFADSCTGTGCVLGRPVKRGFTSPAASVRASVAEELPEREEQAPNAKLWEDSGLCCLSFWLANNSPKFIPYSKSCYFFWVHFAPKPIWIQKPKKGQRDLPPTTSVCPLENSALLRPHPASRQPTICYCAETKLLCGKKTIICYRNWRLRSHYTPRCFTNSWDALWSLPFCLGQGPGPAQQGSGTVPPRHNLQNGSSRSGGLVPPSCPPARPGLTLCPGGGQVRARCLPSKCWGALDGSARIPAHLRLFGGRRRNPQQPL